MPAISRLAKLKRLDLRGNKGLQRSPYQLGNLGNLEVLDLSENQLTEISPAIGRLAQPPKVKSPGKQDPIPFDSNCVCSKYLDSFCSKFHKSYSSKSTQQPMLTCLFASNRSRFYRSHHLHFHSMSALKFLT